MVLRRSRSSARSRPSRVPHVPRALSHSVNLLMVPRMQALMTRLSKRACRSACKNKDRGKELFLSNMVAPPGAGFRTQNEDVSGRETEARKLFIVELSEPRPSGRREPEQACAPGSIWLQRSGRARGHASGENWMVIDSLLISLQRKPTSARGRAHQPDASSRLDPS
jgi:hypothetical protein